MNETATSEIILLQRLYEDASRLAQSQEEFDFYDAMADSYYVLRGSITHIDTCLSEP